jgi:hypothetical protein
MIPKNSRSPSRIQSGRRMIQIAAVTRRNGNRRRQS